ncbi:MAG: helix-turn-helix transcriptional regulator [Acidimicrobiales bacterium]
MNKLERLLNLTAVLLDTRRALTAEEIRRRVEGYPPPGPAFHRTFERDKDDLRVLGIPLRVERAPGTDPPVDGYRIAPDDYYLADPGLEADELAAVHLASLTVRLEGMGEQEALWKLGGVADTGALVADQSVASLPNDPALAPLFQAIVDGWQVSFVYRHEIRTVDPWRLDFQRGRWYLTGFDHLRGEERNFRLDRIGSDVELAGPRQHAAPPRPAPVDGPVPAWELGADEPTTARVLVDAEGVETARRQLGPSVRVEPGPDGSVVFAVPVVNYDAFRTFLFGFLHRAELLEPTAWRDDVIAWLEAIEADSTAGADHG